VCQTNAKGGEMMLFQNPKSFNEALKLLDSYKDFDLVILAGGTDVVPKMNSRPEKSGYFDSDLVDFDKRAIVYLGNAELKYIKDQGDKVVIGAMTTMTEILESDVTDKVPVLKEAIRELAGLTIRNTATIGGNIMNASPAADSVPALMVMDAKIVVASLDGEKTLTLDSIFEGPGKTCLKSNELLKEIIIPVKPGNATFIKYGRRKGESLSIVNGAVYAEFDGKVCRNAKIAIGSVAPTPLRAEAVEQAVNDTELSDEVLAEAAEIAAGLANPIDDKRGSGAYRTKLVKVLVKRALINVSQ